MGSRCYDFVMASGERQGGVFCFLALLLFVFVLEEYVLVSTYCFESLVPGAHAFNHLS